MAEISGERRPLVDDPIHFSSRFRRGSGLGALEGSDGKVFLLGSPGLEARVEVERDVLWGRYEGESSQWFLSYGDENEVFSQYMELLGKHLGARARDIAPRVWCSWYSFYRGISETNLLMVVAGLRGLPLDVFQVDDGWQRDVGDWQPNNRFPRWMDFLAKEIKHPDFKPGIRLAPFVVRPTSDIFQKHPDWILREKHGEPVIAGENENWDGPFYSLDITHPQVLSLTREMIRIVSSWRYEYLKLDFLYAGVISGIHYTPIPGEVAYRNALSALREEAGERYLLACGAPVIASLGVCNGIRIGPDTAPYWGKGYRDLSAAAGAKNALQTVLYRLWLHPLVYADSDGVFFRVRYNFLYFDKKQLLQDLVQIDGFKGTSDPPEWLGIYGRSPAFFEETSTVKRIGYYRYLVGNREVNFKDPI